MPRVLAIADEVVDSLFGARLTSLDADLIVAAGDLPWDYLEFVVSVLDVPMVFVPGNHDPQVSTARVSRTGLHLRGGDVWDDPRPHGGIDADGRVVDAAGLRIAGLGGCVRYRSGPNQYSQREYSRRAKKLVRAARRAERADGRGVDLVLTHAPPLGLGDGDDGPHTGIEALHGLLDTLRPDWHLHGHIHPYGHPRPDRRVGPTTVRNVIPYQVFDVSPRRSPAVADRGTGGPPARL